MNQAMERVLVLGGDGQLGTEFRRALAPQCGVVAVDRADVDIVDVRAVEALVDESHPSLIVNCAAFNDVDRAEHVPLEVLYTNAFAVGTLATLAAKLDAVFVHFSSDFVFDGEATVPYDEADPAHPLSVYGMSKWLGEAAARLAPRHYVLRLSSLYGGAHRRSFIDRIATAAQSRRPLNVFADRVVSPSYTPDVVGAALELVACGAEPGIYHCGSSGHCTWYDLASEVARLLGCAEHNFRSVAFSNNGTAAYRPRFCALSNDKLQSRVRPPRHWAECLQEHLLRHYPPMPPPGS